MWSRHHSPSSRSSENSFGSGSAQIAWKRRLRIGYGLPLAFIRASLTHPLGSWIRIRANGQEQATKVGHGAGRRKGIGRVSAYKKATAAHGRPLKHAVAAFGFSRSEPGFATSYAISERRLCHAVAAGAKIMRA